jgi:pheganomycin biosynthesis PGM1-like protein
MQRNDQRAAQEGAMSAVIFEPAPRSERGVRGDRGGIATHRYQSPIVHALAIPTAHPQAEAWQDGASAPRPLTRGRRVERVGAGQPAAAPRRLAPRRAQAAASIACDEAERAQRFADLQRRMPGVHDAMSTRRPRRAVVVVPSRTIDKWHESAAAAQAYEERLLCSILELRDPDLRMVYVTSSPVAPSIVDYYLSLLPRRLRRGARARLTLIATGERSVRPLSEKLLERPRVLERIGRAIPDRDLCHFVPYGTTELERDVALALDIPMYGADPRHAHFGTKSGCRELFARAGVPHPLGVEHVTSVPDAIAAIASLRAAKPGIGELVMKLNEGVSGEGNAIVDVRGLPEPGAADEAQLIGGRIAAMVLDAPGVSVHAYLAKLAAHGGIVEERIVGHELRSPSVQLQVTPQGEVELLSTHDQLLGGPRGQTYLGCRFPAEAAYAPAISTIAGQIGRRLADAGVIGRSAIDFVVVGDGHGGWHPHAIEINLRKGGTTHPYHTLELLTGGAYDAAAAAFATPTGSPKHYVACDHVEAPRLRTLGRDGVLALTRGSALGFDRLCQRGVVFHMLSCLDELGRTGLTAIGDTAEEAQWRYSNAQSALLEGAEVAAGGRHQPTARHARAGMTSAPIPAAA